MLSCGNVHKLKTPKTREKVGVDATKITKITCYLLPLVLPSTFYLVAFYCIMLDTSTSSTLNIIY